MLNGDSVIIINASEIKVTGAKLDQKEYIWHTGYIGGLKRRGMREQMHRSSENVMRETVRGMLPKTKFGRKVLGNLRIFAKAEYNLQAQKPQEVKL